MTWKFLSATNSWKTAMICLKNVKNDFNLSYNKIYLSPFSDTAKQHYMLSRDLIITGNEFHSVLDRVSCSGPPSLLRPHNVKQRTHNRGGIQTWTSVKYTWAMALFAEMRRLGSYISIFYQTNTKLLQFNFTVCSTASDKIITQNIWAFTADHQNVCLHHTLTGLAFKVTTLTFVKVMKTSSAMPSYMMNICGKFHWNISTKYIHCVSEKNMVSNFLR